MEKRDYKLKPSDKRAKPLPNRLAAFKFPSKVDQAVADAYADRKVDVINKRRFVNQANQNPMDQFFGSLKIFK